MKMKLFRYALAVVFSLAMVSLPAPCHAQGLRFGVCKPVSERTSELGCWIHVDHPIGQIKEAQTFWHLDVYPTRTQAENSKGPRGTVIEAFGKAWLLTIETQGWRPANKGDRVAEIGPLPVTAGEQYSAVFMESVFNPGMASEIHNHSGPEAFYTAAGETCLETPKGKLVSRPGGPSVVVPAGPPMVLTATGTEQRRGLILILHETSKPPTTIVDNWKPQGLCTDPPQPKPSI
jgi:hypothetical protein